MAALRKSTNTPAGISAVIPDGLRDFLNEKVVQYNTLSFITDDPISIPHRFSRREDIEVAGFFAASLAWGNRTQIIRSAGKLMEIMGESPYDFVMEAGTADLRRFNRWVHRTFQPEDVRFFVRALRHVYTCCGSMEKAFSPGQASGNMMDGIQHFRNLCMQVTHAQRSEKHVADPAAGSACKRINLFLRWMARDASTGVDFGLWKKTSPAVLSCPLDVHSGRVARKLGLLTRRYDDARAVAELDASLRRMDANDPVKYDFALFGLGVYEGF